MKQRIARIPFSVKIFGLMAGMLVLLIVSSAINYDRVNQVSDELTRIADYLMPLEGSIAKLSAHAVEQQSHIERVWRLYEHKPVDLEHVNRELQAFERLGQQANREIEEADKLVRVALAQAQAKQNIVELARLQLLIEAIDTEHREFYDHALTSIQNLQQGEREKAHRLQETLKQEEEDMDRHIESARLALADAVERSVRTSVAHERDIMHLNIILIVIAALVGLVYAAVAAVGLTRPVRNLLFATREVEQGNLDVQLKVTSRDEVGELTTIFNDMVRGIREKDRIKATFGQYLDPRIVDDLIQQSGGSLSGGDHKVMTLLFSDVAKFSAISEMLTPDGLVNLINQYLTLATKPIIRNHGVIDKFIGDAVVAFWGPPYADENTHAALACEAALEQFVQLDKLRRQLPDLMGFRRGLPEVTIRIGVATGEVLVGNVGTEHTKSYTVLGPAAHVAEQLEETNKLYGTKIMITQETRRLAQETIETRKIDRIRVDGMIEIFELLSRRGELDAEGVELRDTFEAGLDLYWNQDWDRAGRHFETCLKIAPDDGPARVFLERVQAFKGQSPGADWDGIWV